MVWTNILVPALGGDGDARTLAVARALAEPFGATITLAHASPSPIGVFNWAGDTSFGPTDAAVAALQRNAERGQARCRALLGDLGYPKVLFEAVIADDWMGLRAASRLADVVVWEPAVTRGHGFLAGAFQHILLDERRPAFVADDPPSIGGTVAIAWDGGREASRALRRAIPLLRLTRRIVLLTAGSVTARSSGGARALAYLADQGVPAAPEVLHKRGDPGPAILAAAREAGADLLVAGAFGHPRLQRFIFGGTTRLLLENRATALFLSH